MNQTLSTAIKAVTIALVSVSLAHAETPKEIIGKPDNSWAQFELSASGGTSSDAASASQSVRDYSSLSPMDSVSVSSTHADVNAWGAVNFAQGTLRAYTKGDGYDVSGLAKVLFEDRIFLDQPITSETSVAISMALFGSMTATGGTHLFADYGIAGIQELGGSVSATHYSNPGDSLPTVATTLNLSPGDTYFDLQAFLQVEASPTMEGISAFEGNFGDTAALSIDLPKGMTFHDETGVLLSNPYSEASVPEPASLSLCSLGLVGIFFGRRRKR